MDRTPKSTSQPDAPSDAPEGTVHDRDTVPAPPPAHVIEARAGTRDHDAPASNRRPIPIPPPPVPRRPKTPVGGLASRAAEDPDPFDDEARHLEQRDTLRPAWDSEPGELFDAGRLDGDEFLLEIPPPPPLPRTDGAPDGERWQARNTPLINPIVTREELLSDEDLEEVLEADVEAERETRPGTIPAPLLASLAANDAGDAARRTSNPEIIPPPPVGSDALALASLAPVTRTGPAPVVAEPGGRGARRAALAGALLVCLLAGGWIVREAARGETAAEDAAAKASPAAAVAEAAEPTREAAAPPTAPDAPLQGPEGAPDEASSGQAAVDEANAAAQPAGVASKRPPRRLRRRAKEAAVDPASLPEIPGRASMIETLEALRPALAACASGRSGVAQLDLSIKAQGDVGHAVVGGDFAGTPEGSCIAREVRKARFESFRRPRFRILYPYRL